MIMVWWAHDGRLPEWGFPDVPEIDSGGFYPMFPYSHTLHRIKAHTQAVLENLTDPAHVQFVHQAGRRPSYGVSRSTASVSRRRSKCPTAWALGQRASRPTVK